LKKKKLGLGIAFALALYVLSSCSSSSEAEKGNYIIAKEEQKILVARHISRNDAENKTLTDFKKNNVELINYIVEDAQLYNELAIGEKVNVIPKTNDKGEYVVMQSNPPQIVAGKIERLKFSTQLDVLVVKRIDPLHQSESEFEKNINDKKKVQEVYNKLLDLPLFPQGVFNCPVDNGVQYELTFIHGAKIVSTAVVSAMGCQGVTMNNKAYWAAEPKGNGFIALLEHVLDLSDSKFAVGLATK
jgi:hypothetical protein